MASDEPAPEETAMCRSIKTLRGSVPPATADDLHAAALQFVRKVSGYRTPSAANRDVFDSAVASIASAAGELLDGLAPSGARAPGMAAVTAAPCSAPAPRPRHTGARRRNGSETADAPRSPRAASGSMLAVMGGPDRAADMSENEGLRP